ncbi:MAG: glycosyltransferase family 2 protein [Lachnospiraceae bacterium]|nr:glycosyltransferase family 2 protein [Lachnospiraceae bacterium]
MSTVSIVIPIYNSSPFLRMCIGSIVRQTHDDIDVVCVDDGSTDDSVLVLEEFAKKDSRIRIICNDNEHKGAAGARNRGLEAARGQYVIFLDSDDFFDSRMIETLVQKAEDTKAEIVVCTGQAYDNERERVVGKMPHPDLEYVPEGSYFNWKSCAEYICEIVDNYSWNKLYKRSFLTENKLDFTPIPVSEDQYISMIAPVLAKRIAVVKEAFINYRINTGNSLCDSKASFPTGAYEGTYRVLKQYKELGVWRHVKQSYLNVALRLMREYFDSMPEYSKALFLYNKYRDEIFPMLEATDLPEDYFHDNRVGDWYRMITNASFGEIMFEAARASGSIMTTASLRFRVPYERIKKNSRVVLVGKGLEGRYWYSQLLLSNHCEVVCWIDKMDEIPKGVVFDEVIEVG